MRKWLLLLLLAPALVVAQEKASEDEDAEPVLPSPEYRSVAFIDPLDSADCDPIAARFGACVEKVEFAPTSDLWELPLPPNAQQLADEALQARQRRRGAILRNLSHLHAWLWEDLAFRWNRSGDGIESTLRARGFKALPPPALSWQPGHPRYRHTLSLPPSQVWLGDMAWAVRKETGTISDPEGLFRRVRTTAPEGVRPPRSATLMQGRFAERLGFGKRLHPFDIMDASPASSGPFFEQLVPFVGAMESEDPRIRPLLHLSSPPQLTLQATTDPLSYVVTERDAFEEVVLETENYLAFRAVAEREFELFRRSMGLHIVRFGLEEHTVNQMRVLGSLTAMERPPGWGGGERKSLGRDLVAAAQGETDRPEDVEAMVDRSARMLDTGVRITFSALEDDLVDSWLRRPPRAIAPDGSARAALWEIVGRPSDALLEELNGVVIDLYGELLDVEEEDLERNAGTYRLHSVTEPALIQWASTWLKSGIDPQPIVREIRQIALGEFVAWLTNDPALDPNAPDIGASERADRIALLDERLKMRDEVETWILLDAVSRNLGSQFDPTEGSFVTPGQIATASRTIWTQVLLAHGYLTEPIAQGLNAVDPLSVCTTLDKTEALDEPSFGAVNIDLLVAASDKQTRVGRVLWEARDQIPFLLLDDPSTQVPEMVRLVGLPGGRALYRLRYKVWSGWHVLWSPEPLTKVETDEANRRRMLVPGEQLRLAARTAAFCSDMVFASHDLVPTLVRAALLDGEFRPTRPVLPGEAKDFDEKKAREYKDAQTVLEDAQAGATEASAQASAVGEQVAAVRDGGISGAADLAQGALDGAGEAEATGIEYTEVSERVQYLRDIVHSPLRKMSDTAGGMLLSAFEVEEVDRQGYDNQPARTPYRQSQRPLPDGKSARSSAWTWWVPSDAEEPLGLLSPGYRSGNSVGSSSPTPRWRRGSVADGWLTVGAAFSPFRQVDYCLSTASGDQDVVANEVTKNGCVSNNVPPWSPDFVFPRTQSLRSEAFGIDLQALLAIWGLGEPRFAFEVGGEVRLDMGHGGRSWFYSEDPTYTRPWTFRPAVGFLVGFRAMPLPTLMRRGRNAWPWGSVRPDGRAPLTRGQVGFRGGFLVGPGFNGTEGTGVFEVWAGGSIRRRFGPRASFSPYQPASVIGPFARAQLGFQMGPDDPGSTRNLRMIGSAAVLVGLRVQLRMTSPGKPDQPEAPAAPEAP